MLKEPKGEQFSTNPQENESKERKLDYEEKQALSELDEILPNNGKELFNNPDWERAGDILFGAVSSPRCFAKIYDKLVAFKFEQRDRNEWIETGQSFEVDNFLDVLVEKLSATKEGFEKLKGIMDQKNPGDFFSLNCDDLERNKFDYFRALVVQNMFESNSEESALFFQGYLDKLQAWKESDLKKAGNAEKDNQEKIMEIRKQIESDLNTQKGFLSALEEKGLDGMSEDDTRAIADKIKSDVAFLERRLETENFEDSLTGVDFRFDSPSTINKLLSCIYDYVKDEDIAKKYIQEITGYLKNDKCSVNQLSDITECFERLDANYAASRLLKEIKQEDLEQSTKKMMTNILFRLEFGKIGISEQGARYLERMYDLGEFNRPNYFVQRLTRSGEIGIFDESRELVRYFELGDFSSDEEKIKAQVLSFAYETLFTPRPNETANERTEREVILGEFKNKYFKFFDDRFFQNTGVAFNNFSFREQGQFMHFMEHTDGERKNKALEFVREYRENGFRSFLSLEYGTEMGDKIFDIGEADKERASQIFKDYVRIVDFAEDFYKEIAPVLGKEAGGQFNKYDFTNTMMYSGKKFFDTCWSQIKENPKVSYVGILEEIKKERLGLNPKNAAEGILGGAVIGLVNQIGLEKARVVLNKAYVAVKDENVKKQIDRALSFIIPPEGLPIHQLNDFYEKMIQFENYSYSTNDFEKGLLERFTRKTDKILDLGCGTGRLLRPLKEEYKRDNVMGLDYTGRHVKFVKEKSPEIPVLQGDWTAVGLQGESFDVIYSLGRNILHEYQTERQNQLFSEANRLLLVGGKFIIDIPDRTKGHYKKLVDTHAAIMEERGIKKFRKEGLVYDSPDNKSFATRYLYSNEDIEQLAKQNGFVVEAVEKAELNNGYGDVNLYYVLRKIGKSVETTNKIETITSGKAKRKAA